MLENTFYIVYGAGNDSVGLVGKITKSIADINGNIVDMRQDVIHGLFTIFLVVDLSVSKISILEFEQLIDKINQDTNLKLTAEKYFPIPRNPDKKNMLLILLGSDKPGIIATISETLSKYKINIEFSQNVAREGIFLMELQIDISQCTLPITNLKLELSKIMQNMRINTMFQTEDVFNKKKRIILFHLSNSLMEKSVIQEILKQCEIKNSDVTALFEGDSLTAIKSAVLKLDNLSFDILDNTIHSIKPRPATLELIQTLKTMGYKIVLVSSGVSYFTDYIKDKLNLDYSFGFHVSIDNDTKNIIGEMNSVDYQVSIDALNKNKIIEELMRIESITRDDITIIEDKESDVIPGLGLDFDMKLILDYYNQHILSKNNIIGLLGSFGTPKIK
jgi:phosphoserine phosphatase